MRRNRLSAEAARVLPLVALLASVAPPSAWAAPQDAPVAAATDTDARAAELMGAGNKAFKEGDFVAAESAYRQAFAIKKGYDIAGNLGMAELALGKHAEAARHLAFTLRLFPVTGEPAVREQMQKALERCKTEVGAIHLAVDPRGAGVLVDGVPAGAAPLADDVFVAPGDHVVEAKLDGYTSAREAVTVQKGSSVDVTLALTLVPAPVEPPLQQPAPKPRKLGIGLGIGAVAFTGIIGGAAFLGASAAQRSNAVTLGGQILGSRKSCMAGAASYDVARCPSLQSTLRADDTYHDVGVGALLVGSAAALGTVTYFLWPVRPSPSTGRLRVSPIAGAHEGGLRVLGSF